MSRLRRIVVVLVIVVLSVVVDQATKSVAKQYAPRGETVSYAFDTLRLRYTENSGAFLSLGASLPPGVRAAIFTVGVAIILVVLLGYLLLARHVETLRAAALALIAGGGVGNLIDRVAYDGRVVDFLNVGIGGLRTGIFNVADMAVMAGLGLLIVESFRDRRSRT